MNNNTLSLEGFQRFLMNWCRCFPLLSNLWEVEIEKSEKDRYYNLLIDNYTIKNEIDVHPSFYQWVLILGIIRGIPKEIMQETYTNDMLPLIPEQYIDEFKIIKLRHKSLF